MILYGRVVIGAILGADMKVEKRDLKILKFCNYIEIHPEGLRDCSTVVSSSSDVGKEIILALEKEYSRQEEP